MLSTICLKHLIEKIDLFSFLDNFEAFLKFHFALVYLLLLLLLLLS